MSGISTLNRFIRDPVATQADLPTGTDIQGSLRVVLANNSLWVYDGIGTWTQASGGGGGSGTVDNSTIYLNGSNQIAIKPQGITDNLIANASSIVRNWSNTTPYVIGQIVISSNALWLCRVAGTNSAPSLVTNNWRRLADIDTTNQRIFVQGISANYTWPKGTYAVRADTSGGDITITMNAITTYSDSDTSNRIQSFWVVKDSSANTLTIQLSGTDTFPDGTNKMTLINNGVSTWIYADFAVSKWRT